MFRQVVVQFERMEELWSVESDRAEFQGRRFEIAGRGVRVISQVRVQQGGLLSFHMSRTR